MKYISSRYISRYILLSLLMGMSSLFGMEKNTKKVTFLPYPNDVQVKPLKDGSHEVSINGLLTSEGLEKSDLGPKDKRFNLLPILEVTSKKKTRFGNDGQLIELIKGKDKDTYIQLKIDEFIERLKLNEKYKNIIDCKKNGCVCHQIKEYLGVKEEKKSIIDKLNVQILDAKFSLRGSEDKRESCFQVDVYKAEKSKENDKMFSKGRKIYTSDYCFPSEQKYSKSEWDPFSNRYDGNEKLILDENGIIQCGKNVSEEKINKRKDKLSQLYFLKGSTKVENWREYLSEVKNNRCRYLDIELQIKDSKFVFVLKIYSSQTDKNPIKTIELSCDNSPNQNNELVTNSFLFDYKKSFNNKTLYFNALKGFVFVDNHSYAPNKEKPYGVYLLPYDSDKKNLIDVVGGAINKFNENQKSFLKKYNPNLSYEQQSYFIKKAEEYGDVFTVKLDFKNNDVAAGMNWHVKNKKNTYITICDLNEGPQIFTDKEGKSLNDTIEKNISDEILDAMLTQDCSKKGAIVSQKDYIVGNGDYPYKIQFEIEKKDILKFKKYLENKTAKPPLLSGKKYYIKTPEQLLSVKSVDEFKSLKINTKDVYYYDNKTLGENNNPQKELIFIPLDLYSDKKEEQYIKTIYVSLDYFVGLQKLVDYSYVSKKNMLSEYKEHSLLEKNVQFRDKHSGQNIFMEWMSDNFLNMILHHLPEDKESNPITERGRAIINDFVNPQVDSSFISIFEKINNKDKAIKEEDLFCIFKDISRDDLLKYSIKAESLICIVLWCKKTNNKNYAIKFGYIPGFLEASLFNLGSRNINFTISAKDKNFIESSDILKAEESIVIDTLKFKSLDEPQKNFANEEDLLKRFAPVNEQGMQKDGDKEEEENSVENKNDTGASSSNGQGQKKESTTPNNLYDVQKKINQKILSDYILNRFGSGSLEEEEVKKDISFVEKNKDKYDQNQEQLVQKVDEKVILINSQPTMKHILKVVKKDSSFILIYRNIFIRGPEEKSGPEVYETNEITEKYDISKNRFKYKDGTLHDSTTTFLDTEITPGYYLHFQTTSSSDARKDQFNTTPVHYKLKKIDVNNNLQTQAQELIDDLKKQKYSFHFIYCYYKLNKDDIVTICTKVRNFNKRKLYLKVFNYGVGITACIALGAVAWYNENVMSNLFGETAAPTVKGLWATYVASNFKNFSLSKWFTTKK